MDSIIDSWKHRNDPPPTPVIASDASIFDIIDTVNRQNQQIQSVSSSSTSISMPQTPTLSGEIQYYRPNYLHLTAKTHVSGKELDMGQNPDLFWYWVLRNPCPGVYYCRHDEYYQSNASQYVPFDPHWVIDALGINILDPNAAWEGPNLIGDGSFLEISLRSQQPEGVVTRQVVVNRYTGTIAAQRIYSANKTLLVDSTVKKNRRDSLTGLYLPQKIEITVPKEEFRMTIDLGAPDLNKIPHTALSSWNIPQNLGAPMVNLAQQPSRTDAMSAGQYRQQY